MTPLLPHQEQLLNRLTSERSNSMLVRAPVGAGLTEVLAHLAAMRAGQGDLVLVLTPHRALVEQWADRLARIGWEEVTLALREVDLLPTPSEPPLTRGRVVVASTALLHRPLARRSLLSMRASLLILDGVGMFGGGATADALRELVASAERTIATSNYPHDPAWLSDKEVVQWTPAMTAPPGYSAVRLTVHTYLISEVEASAYTRAVQLVGEATGREVRPASRPALLASVLRAATRLGDSSARGQGRLDFETDLEEAPEGGSQPRVGLEDELWATADALDSLGPDARLSELGKVVQMARANGRPCLVSTDTVEEARYVADYLTGMTMQLTVLTGSIARRDRDKALRDWRAGTVLVATNVLADSIDQPPDRPIIIWWSPPTTPVGLARRLAIGWGEGAEFVVLISSPPLPRDAAFESRVLPWAGSEWWGNLVITHTAGG